MQESSVIASSVKQKVANYKHRLLAALRDLMNITNYRGNILIGTRLSSTRS